MIYTHTRSKRDKRHKMMLFLQTFHSDELELAILLDEPPYAGYTVLKSDEPFAASSNSVLTEATYTTHREGYAWLYVVYASDAVTTWGSKQVRLTAGGTISRRHLTPHGAWTGQYIPLHFQVVARWLFHNVVGDDADTKYTVVIHGGANRADYSVEKDLSRPSNVKHEFLGYQVPNNVPSEREHARSQVSHKRPTDFVSQPLGTQFTVRDHDRNDETWIVGRAAIFDRFRFVLTEFARRPLVQPLLIALGFAAKDRSACLQHQTDPILRQCVHHHLRAATTSLTKIRDIMSTTTDADDEHAIT